MKNKIYILIFSVIFTQEGPTVFDIPNIIIEEGSVFDNPAFEVAELQYQ